MLCLPAAFSASPFADTWHGRLHDLPAVDLRISEAGGKVTGVAVFHLQARSADGAWHISGLESARIRDNILFFQAKGEIEALGADAAPLRFRMELRGANAAMSARPDARYDAPCSSMRPSASYVSAAWRG